MKDAIEELVGSVIPIKRFMKGFEAGIYKMKISPDMDDSSPKCPHPQGIHILVPHTVLEDMQDLSETKLKDSLAGIKLWLQRKFNDFDPKYDHTNLQAVPHKEWLITQEIARLVPLN